MLAIAFWTGCMCKCSWPSEKARLERNKYSSSRMTKPEKDGGRDAPEGAERSAERARDAMRAARTVANQRCSRHGQPARGCYDGCKRYPSLLSSPHRGRRQDLLAALSDLSQPGRVGR